MADRDTLLSILERARWAPSGDNTQPWRFELVDAHHIAIHGHDTRDHVLYDFDGRPSQIAHGALLETLRIAASGHGLEARWQLRPACPDTAPVYDVALSPASGMAADPLLPYIETRVVQRRPMRTTPLTDAQRAALIAAPGPDFQVQVFETFSARLAVARLQWHNAGIRLTCPEAFEVHRDIIEWGVRYSEDRIPDQAVGVDPLTARLMKWVMQSWPRVEFFNRYLLGTIAPRIQLDFIPALACAAHLLLRPRTALDTVEDYVRAGIAMQRLWLTATAQGLHLQPEMTPVIFRWYARSGRSLSAKQGMNAAAERLARRFDALTGSAPESPFVFFARVGVCPVPASRSTRKPLAALMKIRS